MNENTLDLTNLANDLFAAADNVEQVTQELLDAAGEEILAEAQATVVVKTGNLKNSLRKTSSKLRVVVGPDLGIAEYGPFIEYGTGTRGEFPGAMYEIVPKNAQMLSFTVGGKKVVARKVKHPGIRAQPYMRPAAKKWVEDLPNGLADVGVSLITGEKK